jgi:hypothetical protein
VAVGAVESHEGGGDSVKKAYTSPKLEIHGDIRELTLGGPGYGKLDGWTSFKDFIQDVFNGDLTHS